jgi:hypothetical protein
VRQAEEAGDLPVLLTSAERLDLEPKLAAHLRTAPERRRAPGRRARPLVARSEGREL